MSKLIVAFRNFANAFLCSFLLLPSNRKTFRCEEMASKRRLGRFVGKLRKDTSASSTHKVGFIKKYRESFGQK
jgi:hypothetical protein